MRTQPKLTVITSSAGVPAEVRLGNKKFRVMQILEFWRTRTSWWQSGVTAERKVWRVAASSAAQQIVIEICYDPELAQWQLVRKLVG